MVPDAIRMAVRNNGGGHYNHTIFWEMMTPGGAGAPGGALAKAIDGAFGSFATFKEQFAKAGATRFGSGWAWLSMDTAGKLSVESTPEPGHAPLGRPHPAPRLRRLGARLLPQVPEPAPRLHGGLVERGELGRRGEAVREVGLRTEGRASSPERPGGSGGTLVHGLHLCWIRPRV